ncbi:MAG: flavodoxin family protein [bacterium]|nr:flavodoxin family protein [bacterium]
MKYAIVYSSATGNTKMLAETIKDKIGDCYCGAPSEEALDADIIFVGFWTQKNSCVANTQPFLQKLSGKKIFLFGTAGYHNTKEAFDEILGNVKALVPDSNTIIGTYMCQGKVADVMKERIKENRPEMYEAIKENLVEGEHHPDDADLKALVAELDQLNLV